MKRVPQAHRRTLQWLALVFSLTPLVRLTYLDVRQTKLVVLGISINNDRIYLALILALALIGMILFLSAKWGRFFCAFLCPVHLSLETKRLTRKKTWLSRTFILLPFLLAESAVCFLFPYHRQLEFYQRDPFPQPILVAHLVVTGILVSIFLFYRERFCHSGCPYAIFQGVLRADHTVVTVYEDPAAACIDCKACDHVCPMNLNVRKESVESTCSNCTLCIDACVKALGDGHEVITQIREDELDNVQ